MTRARDRPRHHDRLSWAEFERRSGHDGDGHDTDRSNSRDPGRGSPGIRVRCMRAVAGHARMHALKQDCQPARAHACMHACMHTYMHAGHCMNRK
eukprot:357715-Chlamydomonas_euryale.AAC.8